MKFIVPLMAATAMLTVSACKSEAPAPAAEDTADADAMARCHRHCGYRQLDGRRRRDVRRQADRRNASASPNLTTLVAAVKAAGLVDTLSGPGPFTVFAPTNDAFAKVDRRRSTA